MIPEIPHIDLVHTVPLKKECEAKEFDLSMPGLSAPEFEGV
jgi:hypothetical protein